MEQTPQQTPHNSTTPSHAHSINPVGPDGVVRCWHNEPLELLTSKSAANPGRHFYTCYKGRDDPEKCKFFKWADELPGSPVMPQSATTREPVTPTSPSKRAREMQATPSTPTVSPSKAGANAPIQGSSKPNYRVIARDDDEEVQSFSPSDEEISQLLKNPSESDRPTKKFKFQKIDGTSSTSHNDSNTRATASSYAHGAESPSISPTKASTSQWQAIQDDPENPFHARAAALSQARKPGPSASSPATVESITQALETFNSVPDLVKRLERKLIAAEKGRDARANQILKLQKDIQSLKDQNSALEEEVEALKSQVLR